MKLRVRLHEHAYAEDVCYTAINLRGGNTVKYYRIDQEEVFQSNYAFYNLLFHCLRITTKDTPAHYDVQRATATISFCTPPNAVAQIIHDYLTLLFQHTFTSEVFQQAKQDMKNAFADQYKNTAFRARYKSFEVADLHKHYTLKALIQDIEQIDFETFQNCAQKLLIPGNICIYVMGKTQEIDLKNLAAMTTQYDNTHDVMPTGFHFDPYLRQDAHIERLAREEHYLVVTAFDFINPNVTNFTKRVILEMLSQNIIASEVDVWVDFLDASITFSCETLRAYKRTLVCENEANFEQMKATLLTRCQQAITDFPEHFAVYATILMQTGIAVDEYIHFLGDCTYPQFSEICREADYKISEAQIVMRRRTNDE